MTTRATQLFEWRAAGALALDANHATSRTGGTWTSVLHLLHTRPDLSRRGWWTPPVRRSSTGDRRWRIGPKVEDYLCQKPRATRDAGQRQGRAIAPGMACRLDEGENSRVRWRSLNRLAILNGSRLFSNGLDAEWMHSCRSARRGVDSIKSRTAILRTSPRRCRFLFSSWAMRGRGHPC
jgi:hypothetical protein